jgi:hypothetical protein
MKALIGVFTSSLALACLGLGCPASAEIIGADDFSEADGTPVNGKPADVGGATWQSGSQTIVGGALDTDSVGQHSGSFLNLTRALGPGEILTMNFTSKESAGLMFDINGYAGMSFYIDGSEKLFIGDPGGGQAVNGWSLDGFAGGVIDYSGLQNEAVTGVFTYAYDTGVGTLNVTDGVNVGTAVHFYDAGLALNRFRIQSGSSDAAAIAIDSFSIFAGVPEPTSAGIVAVGALVSLMRRRK